MRQDLPSKSSKSLPLIKIKWHKHFFCTLTKKYYHYLPKDLPNKIILFDPRSSLFTTNSSAAWASR